MIAFYHQTKTSINFYVLILQGRQVFIMFIVSMSQGLENVMFLITNFILPCLEGCFKLYISLLAELNKNHIIECTFKL